MSREQVRLLAGERERAAHVLLPVLAHVAAGDRHAPLLGVEEPEEEARDRGLAGAARPDERDPLPRLEPEVDAAQRRRGAVRVARRHALERDGAGAAGRERAAGSRDAGSVSVGSRTRRPRRESTRAPVPPPAAGDGVERREREQRQRRHEHAIESSRLVGRDRHREDAYDREPGDEDRERIVEAGDERVAAAEAGELRSSERMRASVRSSWP